MSQITRTLGANQSESISASGSRIYVMQATGLVRIQWHSDYLVAQAGDKITSHAPFDSVRIKDESGAQNTVELAILSGDLSRSQIAQAVSIDDSVPLNVNVADQTLSQYPELRAGQSFIAGANIPTNQAGATYWVLAISNPANSGKALVGLRVRGTLQSPTSGIWLCEPQVSPDSEATIAGILANTQAVNITNQNPHNPQPTQTQAIAGTLTADYASAGGTLTAGKGAIGADRVGMPLDVKFSFGAPLIQPGQSLVYNFTNIGSEGTLFLVAEWAEEVLT